MVMIARSGRARISPRRPRAIGECDRCSLWWNHDVLRDQMQWSGNSLVRTGLLVCPECDDKPQDQFRTPVLRPDPYPVRNARVSPAITPINYIGQSPQPTPGNQGFLPYILGAPGVPGTYPSAGANLSDPSTITAQQSVLAQVATLSGVPTPAYTDRSRLVVGGNASQLLVPYQPYRTWLLLYNPTAAPVEIALQATTTWSNSVNLPVGPGEALLWSSTLAPKAQVGQPVSVIGLVPNMPFFAWSF